ncbi:MAG: ATP-dependent DNA helicase [Pseudomonadota bacterium]
MNKVQAFFAEDGTLASKVSDYSVRHSQVSLSEQIADAIDDRSTLIAEAGTGIGKTFAYLVPVFLSDGKAIVSTGTKNLQEQLFVKDLPLIKHALDSTRRTALLKGRANYLCIYRLGLNGADHIRLDKQTLEQYREVTHWSVNTKTGDMSELSTLPENAPVTPLVTSTVDNCLGKDCKHYDDCFLIKARQKALSADIIVVNHHLFFADLALKEEGIGELIPNVDAIVFDEAHLLPDIASEHFGVSFSTRQVDNLLSDIQKIQKTEMKDAAQLSLVAQKTQQALANLRLCFGAEPQRSELAPYIQRPDVVKQLKRLSDNLQQLTDLAHIHEGRSTELDRYFERLIDWASKLQSTTQAMQTHMSRWFETTKRHLIFHITPLNISQQFGDIVQKSDSAWIFTSATLSVGNSFDHYSTQMGLHEANSTRVKSPFNYQKQAMLCVPRGLPSVSDISMKDHLVEVALRLLKASKGNAFFLFTSHYMMRQVSALVDEKTSQKVLVQGDASKRSLLKDFIENENAALFATGAFWEGVDVKGDALQCVMIDKLPFGSPDEPLLKARVKDCRNGGGDPFHQIQVPQAVIGLKQGAGRLIRDASDRGVLIICDNRLVNKPYAKTFLSSLPDMQRTRSLDKVEAFLQVINGT